MTEFQGTRNKPANNGSRMERGFAVEPRPAPPAYRPNHGGLQPKMVAPPVYRPTAGLPVQSKTISPRVFRPGTTPQVFRPVAHIQPYVPKKSERSAIVELRNRYVKANGDDYAHYAGTFDEYVDSADTMEQIVEFVVAAEKVAARKTVPKDPPPTVLQKPPQTPASSPAAKQQRAEKQKEKKRQKALDKQSRTIDLSIPAQPVPLQTQWKAVATASASLPAPTPSPASKQLSFVENLLAKVEKWDRKTDKGKTVSLSESQATELLYGLKAIATSGGQQAFYVGFSDNEQKYNCKVCIKAIAGYSQTVSQATTHKPTYHFTLDSDVTLPEKFRLP
jgi:hypothetical protein